MIVHDQTSRTGIDRRDGFVNQMTAKYPDIEIVGPQYGGGDQLKSTDLAKAIIQANPDLKGFFGANEGSAIGVVNAVKELDMNGKIVVIGYDSGKAQIDAINERRHARRDHPEPDRHRRQVRRVGGQGDQRRTGRRTSTPDSTGTTRPTSTIPRSRPSSTSRRPSSGAGCRERPGSPPSSCIQARIPRDGPMSTIRDVARRAGVSTMTVSRVINRSGYTSPETRTRVERAIADLGYVPNAVARHLRSKRTKTIALVLSDITNPFFTTIARGVEDVAGPRGFGVMFCNTDESASEEISYLHMLIQRQVDGVLLVPAGRTVEPLRLLREQGVPVVVVDRRVSSARSIRSGPTRSAAATA